MQDYYIALGAAKVHDIYMQMVDPDMSLEEWIEPECREEYVRTRNLMYGIAGAEGDGDGGGSKFLFARTEDALGPPEPLPPLTQEHGVVPRRRRFCSRTVDLCKRGSPCVYTRGPRNDRPIIAMSADQLASCVCRRWLATRGGAS